MFERCNLLFMAILMASALLTQAHFPEYCAECEQEVWEQVPCSEVPTTASPTTTAGGSTTSAPTTAVFSTTERGTTTTSAPPTPTDYITPPSTYKKCYCECKLGCKEFCRKVISSGPKQPLTQISSIGEYAPGGQVEFTHVHQRKYFPKYGGDGYGGLVGPVGGPKAYKPYPLVYEQAAAASAASPPSISAVGSSPAVANLPAPNYTLEELAQLLSTAYGTKKGYPASEPAQPRQLQPAPVAAPPSVYYSPIPVYRKQQAVPLVSKVAPAPKISSGIKYAAAAVSSSSGVSVAKIKTPYEEKVVVATPSPIYDRTTSYPIVEAPKEYSAPQTELYPVEQSQTEAYPSHSPIYASPTESYPSHKDSYPSQKDSYPSHKDSYPSVTEAYPSQTESYQPRTEAYPVPEPQPEVKPYGGPESGPDKPSSTFDLAIDNYLKDFGYGNQGRGYADY
ncbi:adhesive plaque matrix protein [Drosophila subpulchrella]|uniref:adhesive plaque matrix protein n=1 Tax=Drosophila subpulchrella TaxID=1486046 RepID=UPI0018A15B1B|nr:adhesive plaque matrix protein [Drosophila subpulchrella]